ncbi:E3 ubiquitin-protein ligase TRIM39-like isoform X2 [Latimeria chalumnae]|uniref:E3 ubiquitin-protein ligase TRIM39-like isoform X2 n=1 Tax=Latimeria chalumnae TaxID=7897 RepID=UPI00313BF7F4
MEERKNYKWQKLKEPKVQRPPFPSGSSRFSFKTSQIKRKQRYLHCIYLLKDNFTSNSLNRPQKELSLTEKHLELDYEVDSGHRVTVTLDPNTAHPQLTLSEDLTAVTLRSTWRKDLPDNPERFDLCSCVLGSEGFTSGRHSWVVDVEKQTLYFLGVAAESANRKGIIDLKPELGYWTVQLGYGGYTAFTDEGETRQKVLKTPKKVLVCVDYEAGKVSFSNADDRSHIYTFTHKFKHKIFPFFYLWTVGAPLRICNL